MIFFAAAGASDVDIIAATLKLRPVLFIVTMYKYRVILPPWITLGIPDIGNIDIMVPPVASEPFDFPWTHHCGVPGFDHNATVSLSSTQIVHFVQHNIIV